MPKPSAASPPMFESPFVDWFSRTHFAVVPVLYVPASAALLWYSCLRSGLGYVGTAAVAALGFFTWTLAEYWLHRVVFHWEPPGVWGRRIHFWLHGVHHRWPHDRYRLVMPPAVSLVLFVVFLSVYRIVIEHWAWAFHAGFVIGYTYYDLMHYYLHHGKPRNAYLRRLRRHHMLHHFTTTDRRFGVSWTHWDRVFGTFRSASQGRGAHRGTRPSSSPAERPGAAGSA